MADQIIVLSANLTKIPISHSSVFRTLNISSGDFFAKIFIN